VGGSSVNGRLDLFEGRLQDRLVVLKVHVDLEEGLQDLLGGVPAAANSLLHLVEGVLGGVEQGLVHGPVIVLGELLDLFSRDGLNMLIQLVRANGLDQVLNSTFNFVILAAELLGLNSDPFLLHLDEFVKSVGLGILGQVDEHGLGERLEVVLNTVLHDVVDVDDQLLELGEALVDVGQVAVNVHGSPGKGNHTGSQLVLKILEVGHEERLGVGTDLVDDAVVLAEDELQLVVVVLELLFLEEDDLGGLGNVDSDTGKALCFTDQGEDLRVEVHVQLIVVGVTDNEGGLETGFRLLDLKGPLLAPEVLVREESVTNLVILFDGALVITLLGELWGELFHRHGDAVEQVTGPGDGTGHSGQVPDNWGRTLELLVLLLD
jgi:hypothetical protein